MTEENEDLRALQLALTHIDREYGKGTIVRLGDDALEPIPAISTGALTLDLALGIGGLPKGRIVEIYGPESSGKTTVALNVIAEAQKQGGVCAFIDVEHALDPQYAQALGVDLDKLYFSQPDYGEAALDIIDKLVNTGCVSVIVLDSVAALSPKAEIEGDIGDSHMGIQARLMGQALRKLVGPVSKSNTLLIFTNQLREKIGIFFGNPETQPGGRALKFYSSVRIDIRRVSDIKATKDGEITGVKTKAKVIKNKTAPPLKVAEFDILYGKGVSRGGCLFDAALNRGVITGSGWYSYKDEKLGQGRANIITLLEENEELFEQVKEDVINASR